MTGPVPPSRPYTTVPYKNLFDPDAFRPLPAPAPAPAAPPPVAPRVRLAVKRAGKTSIWLLLALPILDMLYANEPDMARAATTLKSGVAARFDGGFKNLITSLQNTARNGWVALDEQEFERVLILMARETEVLRASLTTAGGMIDEIAAGYRTYWIRVGAILASTLLMLYATMFMEHTSPFGKILGALAEKFIGKGFVGAVAGMTAALGLALASFGDNLRTIVKKQHQFGFTLPVGVGAVDYTQATLDVSKYPSFRTPAKPGDLPPGYQQFEWEEPTRKVD